MRDLGTSNGETATALLNWYDRNARELPWRTGPHARARGVWPDPYHVWLSEIMLQQTTVAAVRGYFLRFTALWPDVTALADANDDDVMGEWAGLGYYARARNLLKCARIVQKTHGGSFPDTRDSLVALPGIGPYTAAAISAIAFDRPETVVDGNVERVVARLFDVHAPLPSAKRELTALAEQLTPKQRAGDYAQAAMDLGATICTPKSPACGLCPLRPACKAHAAGTAADLPRKSPRKPKPTRYGTVYIAQRADGALLLERRPGQGLLGGMLGWPGTEWGEARDDRPPFDAPWTRLAGEVRHTFTHFHLVLDVCHTTVPNDFAEPVGQFIERANFRPSGLPTVMRKVFDLWRDH